MFDCYSRRKVINSARRLAKRIQRQSLFPIAIMAVLGILAAVSSLSADPCNPPLGDQYDCPAAPTSYPNGVIEGRVAPSCACPGNKDYAFTRGMHACVAIDDSAAAGNPFLVVWVSDLFTVAVTEFHHITFPQILAAKFDAGGNCLVGPRSLSSTNDIPGGDFVYNYNDLPSVAISSGQVRAAWTGTTTAAV